METVATRIRPSELAAAFEADKRRIRESGDPRALATLEHLEHMIEDGSLWSVPTVREALAEEYARHGLD